VIDIVIVGKQALVSAYWLVCTTPVHGTWLAQCASRIDEVNRYRSNDIFSAGCWLVDLWRLVACKTFDVLVNNSRGLVS